MKKFCPFSGVFKLLSFLILILVLVVTPCGIKQSVKQVFKIENLSSNIIKSGSSCTYLQSAATQNLQKVALLKNEFQYSFLRLKEEILISTSIKTGSRKARSIPLYLLYQQLRTFLV